MASVANRIASPKRLLFTFVALALSLGACAGEEGAADETGSPVADVSLGGPGDASPARADSGQPDTQESDALVEVEDVSEQATDVASEDAAEDTWSAPEADSVDASDGELADSEASLADVQDNEEEDTGELDAGTSDDDAGKPEELDAEEEEEVEDTSGPEVELDLKGCKDACAIEDQECTGVCGGSPLCLAQCAAANTDCLDACEAAFGD